MAPPNPPRTHELNTLVKVQAVATLAPTRFKAAVNLACDFVAANEEKCAPRGRVWTKPTWRELSARFTAEYADDLWDENRENVKTPTKEEENGEPNGDGPTGATTTSEEGGAANGDAHQQNQEDAQSTANGDAASPSPKTPTSANKKKGKSDKNFDILDREDALIFPRDADTITFISFNLLKLQAQKFFSSAAVKRRAGPAPTKDSSSSPDDTPASKLVSRQKSNPQHDDAMSDASSNAAHDNSASPSPPPAKPHDPLAASKFQLTRPSYPSFPSLSDSESKDRVPSHPTSTALAPDPEIDEPDPLVFSIPAMTHAASPSIDVMPGRIAARSRKDREARGLSPRPSHPDLEPKEEEKKPPKPGQVFDDDTGVKALMGRLNEEDVYGQFHAPKREDTAAPSTPENATKGPSAKLRNVNVTLLVTVGRAPSPSSSESEVEDGLEDGNNKRKKGHGGRSRKKRKVPKTLVPLMRYQGWKHLWGSVHSSLPPSLQEEFVKAQWMVLGLLRRSGEVEETQVRIGGVGSEMVEAALNKALGGCVDAGLYLMRGGGEVEGFVRGEGGADEVEVGVRFE